MKGPRVILRMAFGLILAPFGVPLGVIFAKSGASEAPKIEVIKSIENWSSKGSAADASNPVLGV